MEIEGFHLTTVLCVRLHFQGWVCVCVRERESVCCTQDASLIFISGYKSSWLCCGAGQRAAAGREREDGGSSRGVFGECSGFTGFWSCPRSLTWRHASPYEYLWEETAAVEAIHLIWKELRRCTGSDRVSRRPGCCWIPAKPGRLCLSSPNLSSLCIYSRTGLQNGINSSSSSPTLW